MIIKDVKLSLNKDSITVTELCDLRNFGRLPKKFLDILEENGIYRVSKYWPAEPSESEPYDTMHYVFFANCFTENEIDFSNKTLNLLNSKMFSDVVDLKFLRTP